MDRLQVLGYFQQTTAWQPLGTAVCLVNMPIIDASEALDRRKAGHFGEFGGVFPDRSARRCVLEPEHGIRLGGGQEFPVELDPRAMA